MPGSSLWLVPPEESELYKTIHDLILRELPAIYPTASPRRFTPHITLTSDVDAVDVVAKPQDWLDDRILPNSVSEIKVAIGDVQVGTPFVKKLTMVCERSAELCELALRLRVDGVQGVGMGDGTEWVEKDYAPHCSLMYSDIREIEVKAKLDEVNKTVKEVKQRQPKSKTAKGGSIWLVPTFKEIDEWKPIAIRRLPGIEWDWQT